MCKLYVATGKLTERQIKLGLLAASRELGKTEKDGFGFIIVGETIAYGRYLYPLQFCGFKSEVPGFFLGPNLEKGKMPKNPYLMICHARTSTNKVSVVNCHPFEKEGTYLVHNGIVDWIGDHASRPKSRNSCDSDSFLSWLVDGGDIFKAKDFWSGFAAIFAYDSKVNKLTLIKDGSARLQMARRKVGGWVFCTDEFNLKIISQEAGISLDTPAISVPMCIVNFSDTGEIKEIEEWDGLGDRQWDYLSRSTGVAGGYHGAWAGELSAEDIPLKRTYFSTPNFNETKKIADSTNNTDIGKEKFPDYVPQGV